MASARVASPITPCHSSMGNWLVAMVERREGSRVLLFHLMEIRHELLIERPKLNAAVDEFQDEFKKILGDRPNLKSIMVNEFPKEYVATVLTTCVNR